MKDQHKREWNVVCTASILLIAYLAPVLAQTSSKVEESKTKQPRINITLVPRFGKGGDEEMEKIAGTVKGVKAEEYNVVLFALTDKWYVQPYIDSPYTSINSEGKWESDTHLGKEYAALLVKPSYKPPDTTKVLPTVSGDVIAITRVPGKR